MPHDFLAAWQAYTATSAPFVLPGDEVVLSKQNGCGSTAFTSLRDYTSSRVFGLNGDTSLHLGLCPVPFVGNPSKASVFILMLNPGFSPSDYFAEEQDEIRRIRWANLKGESDFIGLDPRFAWTSDFAYWQRKFGAHIAALSNQNVGSYQAALQRVAAKVCVLEMVPYYSSAFGLSDRVVNEMASPKLVKRFVHEEVLPKARAGEALVVVTRQAKRWGVEGGEGTVVYEGNDTRAAHIGQSSPAGALITKFLSWGHA